jgi:RNA polymerase sigma-70 factor (ECF subfamily)
VSESEDELVARAVGGDRAAFDLLARDYAPRLERFAALMGVEEAGDVSQEALQEAFGSISRFRTGSKLSTWLIGIALNLCRRWHRKRAAKSAARPGLPADRIDDRSPDRSIFSNLVRREDAGRIALALDALPPSFREAFLLKHLEGLDYREIGRLTGVAEGTARVRAHRASVLLRNDLGPAFETLLAQSQKQEEAASRRTRPDDERAEGGTRSR